MQITDHDYQWTHHKQVLVNASKCNLKLTYLVDPNVIVIDDSDDETD